MDITKVVVTVKGTQQNIEMKGYVNIHNLQNYYNQQDDVLMLRTISGQNGVDLHRQQIVSVEKGES